MKVQLVTNLGSGEYPWTIHKPEDFTEGKKIEVSEEVGATLVKRGHAVLIDVPKPVVVAEPEKESVAEVEKPEPDKFQKTRAQHGK